MPSSFIGPLFKRKPEEPADKALIPLPKELDYQDSPVEAWTPDGRRAHRWVFDGKFWVDELRQWTWAELVFDVMQSKWELRRGIAEAGEAA